MQEIFYKRKCDDRFTRLIGKPLNEVKRVIGKFKKTGLAPTIILLGNMRFMQARIPLTGFMS